MNDPTLLLKTYLETEVEIKCKDSIPLNLILYGFDEHCNILGVEKEGDDKKLIFIRGDTIIYIGKRKVE